MSETPATYASETRGVGYVCPDGPCLPETCGCSPVSAGEGTRHDAPVTETEHRQRLIASVMSSAFLHGVHLDPTEVGALLDQERTARETLGRERDRLRKVLEQIADMADHDGAGTESPVGPMYRAARAALAGEGG